MACVAVLLQIPYIVRGAELLPEPIEVAAKIDWYEEELRLFRILCPGLALQQVLVHYLHSHRKCIYLKGHSKRCVVPEPLECNRNRLVLIRAMPM